MYGSGVGVVIRLAQDLSSCCARASYLQCMASCDACGSRDTMEIVSGSEGNHTSLVQCVLQSAGGSVVIVVE